MITPVPAIVLGASGYVAGELLRLIAAHPSLTLVAAVSASQAGVPLRRVFPHLHDALGGAVFVAKEELQPLTDPRVAIFSAAPHGASATLLAEILVQVSGGNGQTAVVDISADFRFSDPGEYARVYGAPHPAPELLQQFSCALPEQVPGQPAPYIAHPGCFATAMLLAAVPLIRAGVTEERFFAAGITGSTGSGRKPADTTHHPFRHANLYAYRPLRHRHAPEVCAVAGRVAGRRPALHFVPHSGPFARGIHMSLQAPLRSAATADELRNAFADYYAGQRFVEVVDGCPRIKDVVGSNHAQIGIQVEDGVAVVMVTIDNLLKGAAGGAMQWMNRLLGFDESCGLALTGPGWI